MHTRPVWAEISQRRLLDNFHALRTLAGEALDLMTVVKADAYGHAIELCAPLLAGAGKSRFGVTSVEEGVRLRALVPHAEIIVMGGIWEADAEAILEHRLTPFVWENYQLDLLERAARARKAASHSVPVHLELDTGMARQGVRVCSGGLAELDRVLARFAGDTPLHMEAVTTHFAAPEDLGSDLNGLQIAWLGAALRKVHAAGLHPRWISAGSSATLLAEWHLDSLLMLARAMQARLMVRPGIALYGYPPPLVGDPAGSSEQLATLFQPVLSLKARIGSLRTLAPGETAGYNGTFRAQRTTRVALLPIGYADGFNRLLSNRGSVLIHGRRAPIAGRISMDQSIVDVTDIPGAAIGDEVVIVGEQGGGRIYADQIAALLNTIPYEVLCAISARVPRLLVDAPGAETRRF